MPIKPSNLIYGLDDRPPLWATVLLAIEHISIISIGLIFPVVIIREGGGTSETAARLVALSMIAGGIGVVVQALRRGPVGSGYLCPQVCGPSFLSASILAVKTGGLSLLLGTTLLAGCFEALLSRFLNRLRALFPTEVTGLIVAMVGITVVKLAAKNFFGIGAAGGEVQSESVAVAAATLAAMIGLNVWSKGKIKLFCILIGMAAGYSFSWMAGLLGSSALVIVAEAPMLSFPFLEHPGWSLRAELIVPALVATLCSTLKSIGDITTCQKINDGEWKRPDMKNIGSGILADAIGAISAGLLGGVGQSSSSSNIGLSIATGATSRVIAWFIGGLLIITAFCPKVASFFAIMPQPVIGATLIFALSFMVIAGIQIIMSRMMDARKTFVVGTSMIFGLSVDMVPQAYQGLHPWIQPIFSSSLSAATVMAVVLNLIFRLGVSKKALLELREGDSYGERIFSFMDQQGGLWGVRREVVQKAQASMNEFMEAATILGLTRTPVTMEARFNEYNLDVDIVYQGRPIVIPTAVPGQDELIEDETAAARLALLLVGAYADRTMVQKKGQNSLVSIHFDH
ncbi:MAG: xanthine permease [Desulfobacteraceae bacterium]|nr:MAG: xanthine permease [Desulfobacteraceae bacterium]